MSGFVSKLVSPKFPPVAASIEAGKVAVVQLDRVKHGFKLRRGSTLSLPESLVTPNFEVDSNISDLNRLANALSEVALSAGLGKQRKWSVALPEGATRSIILTLESAPTSKTELLDILKWKTERGFGVPESELQVSRNRLAPDATGRIRYLATAIRKGVLAEFEAVFEALSWRVGLILPRSAAESQWLTVASKPGDSMLVSSHHSGFLVSVYRAGQPLALRSVICDSEDRQDELYRFLLFYRDRLAPQGDDAPPSSIQRLLIAGDNFPAGEVVSIASETLDTQIHSLEPEEVGFAMPTAEFSFRDLAAPSALAALAW